MNKKTKEELSKTIVKNDYDKSIRKLIKKIERNQKDCKYMSGQLCEFLKEVKEDFITLQTPFDIVYIKLKKDKKSKVEETEVEEKELKETEVSAGAWKRYVNLSKKIEELIPDKNERIAGLEKIYDYLNILKDENITSIEQFNSKVKKEFNVKNTNKYDENGKNIREKGTDKEEN
jgi:phosphate-selective porin